MSYEPAVASFILVGMVGGAAMVMNASYGWEISHELAKVTDHWTLPVVVRSYDGDAKARERLAKEAEILRGHGYAAALPEATRRPDARPDALPSARIVIAYQLS